MIKRTLAAAIVSACLLASGASLAHHSLSGVYDIRASGEVTGVIKSVEFINPHGVMTLEVPNADGTATEWKMTTGSANTLQGLGFGGGGGGGGFGAGGLVGTERGHCQQLELDDISNQIRH